MASTRCAEPDCTNLAQGASPYCLAHGGGARGGGSDSASMIGVLWALGLVLAIGGGVLAVAQYPSIEVGVLGGPEETGSEGAFVAGLFATAAGQLLLMVAAAASGARLAIRAEREAPAT